MIWSWLNWISVFLFGTVLTLSFLKLNPTRKNVAVAVTWSAGCILVQAIIVYLWGFDAVNKTYPLIVHLPLCLLCVLYYKKSLASTVFALLAVYLLTIPRNWLGLMLAVPFSSNPYAVDIAKLVITLPLLLLLLRFWAPRTWAFLSQPDKVLWILLVPFALFYGVSYASTVYTQLLYSTNVLVISFIMTAFAAIIFILSSVVGNQNAQVMTLQQKQELLTLQSSETKLRLEEIHRSQQEARAIRHDTRHYFQMIDSYAAAGDTAAIREYIHQIDAKIDATKVKQYCLNEQVNLVLSSGLGKAKALGVEVSVDAEIPEKLEEDRCLDLCILLANAIENATAAAGNAEKPWLELHAGMVGVKLVIQISNSYAGKITFDNGFPKSHRAGHGFGTYSIAMLTEKHGGTADFSCEGDVFTVRAVL